MDRKLARLAVMVVDFLLFTCRIEVVGRESVEEIISSGKFIYASWHGRLILFFLLVREHRTAVMTSRSSDGTIAASMQEVAGCAVFRGSSQKGGKTALEKITQYMISRGQPAMLSVDGPVGPIYKTKPGVARLSRDTGFPIVPITFSGKKVKVFKSWDRCMIPKPFSKCTLLFGSPIFPSDNIQETVNEVDEVLNTMTRKLDSSYGQAMGALC